MERTQNTMQGHNLTLRLVEEDDAAYILGLRQNPKYNTYISQVTGTVDDQRSWITSYRAREAAGTEYYFIIFRNDDNTRCGTVRLYDIHDGQFTWGSWILDENKPHKAALDSAIQVYKFGFDVLGMDKSVFDVRKDNLHTLKFHDRFGSVRTGEDDLNIYYLLPKVNFLKANASFDALFTRPAP